MIPILKPWWCPGYHHEFTPTADRGPDDPTALELFRHLATSVGAWSRVSAPGVLSTRRNGTVILWWVMSHYLVGSFKHDWTIFHNIWDNHDNPSHWLIFFRRVEITNQLQLTHHYWALNWSKVKIPSIEHDRNEDHRWTCRWWPPRGVSPHCDCEASIRWVSSVFLVFTFVQDLKLSYKKPPKKQ